MNGDKIIDIFDIYASTVASNKKKLKARKEATASDLRQYIKQFRQAKSDEYTSWKKNEVFE